jgi:hypothetical protein
MAIPPIRDHGQSGHLQDHNDLRDTLSVHDGYLDQGVKTSDSPIFGGVRFGQTSHSSAVINITNNLNVTIDSFTASAYRSAEYNIQFTQGNKYANSKVTVLHDGSNAGISEYGKVEMGASIPYTLSADISGVNVLLSCQISNGDSSSATLKFYRTIINL